MPINFPRFGIGALVHGSRAAWFINGQPLADVRAIIEDVSKRPRPSGLRSGYAHVLGRSHSSRARADNERSLAFSQKRRADERAPTPAQANQPPASRFASA